MSLKLSKNNIIPYEYFSEGNGLDPITTQITLDNLGGIKGSDVVSAFLIATIFNYTTIIITPINEEIGIDWKVSLDNSTWFNSVNINELLMDQNFPVYFAAVVNNDGSVNTGNYLQCKIKITAVESPP